MHSVKPCCILATVWPHFIYGFARIRPLFCAKIICFFINFQHKIKEKFSLEVDYVITYNSLDESLEHLTTLFFSWRIAEWISWTVDARYAKETLKDKDITQVYQTYFTLRL